ncbi:MAG: hypothetical protein ISR54_07735 [Chlorobium phaeobacteroides]|nr:hypothetical protein [Chlorobium phaeobacteroides]
MNLLVLPGGGNPDTSSTYCNVYEVIAREAKKYGYAEIYTDVRWPGHISISDSYDEAPSLTLSGAMVSAREAINRLPDKPYSVLARSFGCFVALKLAACQDENIQHPAKIILWGPDPYWLLWKDFVRDLEIGKVIAREKGLKVDKLSFASIEPIESLIHKARIETFVVSGANDSSCSPAYLDLN